ncbi:hypothetical protein ETAA8_45530 [Anatilimnocola aggregata]|uniref:Uncharacterized protein n=1 Tax=Anatilimnocola aggregata TaxID=2528021 RepID=A0A517YGU1_9BACT|nr:hypothetical protein ETAA8_45530 [Anatilimnocola aggregata]
MSGKGRCDRHQQLHCGSNQKSHCFSSDSANIFQSLLLVIAGATQKELARQVKYLKVENQILR